MTTDQFPNSEIPVPNYPYFNVGKFILGSIPFVLILTVGMLILAENSLIPYSWEPYHHLIIAGASLLGGGGMMIRVFLFFRKLILKSNNPDKDKSYTGLVLITGLHLILFVGLAIWAVNQGKEGFIYEDRAEQQENSLDL